MLVRIGSSRQAGWMRTCGTLAAALVLAVNLAAQPGCVPPSDNLVLSTITGEPLDMASINAILDNTNLTTTQKREHLEELGVPSETIDVLLAG